MNVMVGGTFDPLHAGHRVLLSRSFEIAGRAGTVTIGLTSDEFVQKKSHPVRPYDTRKRELICWIGSMDFEASYTVECLSDQYGSALNDDFDALVVSEETFPVAEEINRLREEMGKKRVDIYTIQCILADDGKIVSSTRIYRGEIDPDGHLIR
ncbi:phosphopantetheine adenylyltransferase [Methanocalculus alkaliphilus]|uniref:phosphopantetheine adenylyltransferase n=1 Tax=Methanocalculus alkaliphilus TaxID=768730 RepID=UPI00209E8F9C|nr:phosphopantetheine adenylyltransferase [Methanocalculus alkaliphilus]